MGDSNILKKKLIITFTTIFILIIISGVLGWILTEQIENSGVNYANEEDNKGICISGNCCPFGLSRR